MVYIGIWRSGSAGDIMDMSPLPFYQEDMGAQLKGFSWFSGAGARGAVNAGFGEYLPCYYRDVPALLTQYTRVDAFFAVVSPMDEQGYFSFGPVGSCTESLLKKSDRVFLQVNHNVPRSGSGRDPQRSHHSAWGGRDPGGDHRGTAEQA